MRLLMKHKYLFLTILFILISYIMFGLFIFNDNIWYDEAYQMVLNRYSFSNIVYYIKNDTNGPLYAILLKIVTSIFGDKLYVGRLLSLSIYNIQFIIAFYPMRKLFNLKTSIIYSIISILSSYSLFCSTEIRLYSLSMISVLGAVIYGLLYFKDNNKSKTKNLIFYTIFGIIGTYAHNYATLTIFFLQIMTTIMGIIKKDRKIIITNIIIFICYIPWLRILFKQEEDINGNFWISKPSIDTFTSSMRNIFSNNNLICFILVFIIIYSLINIKKYKRFDINILLVIIPAFLTITLFVIYSMVNNPLFVSKYITPDCGLIYTSISAILVNNNINKNKYLVYLYILLIIPNFIAIYKDNIQDSNDSGTKEMIEFINKNYKGRKIFLNTTESALGLSEYYFPGSKHYLSPDTYLIIRKENIFGDVVRANNYKYDRIIVIYTDKMRHQADFNYFSVNNYHIENYFTSECTYNGGYMVYILKKNY